MSRQPNLSDEQKDLWDLSGQRIFRSFCRSAGWNAKRIERELNTNSPRDKAIGPSLATKYLAGNESVNDPIQRRYPDISTISMISNRIDSYSQDRNDADLESYARDFREFSVEIRRLCDASGVKGHVRKKALAEMAAAERELTEVLKTSRQLVGQLISFLKLKVVTEENENEDEKRAAEVARELVTMDPDDPDRDPGPYRFGRTPYQALLTIRSIRKEFYRFDQGGSREQKILTRMFEILAILIFGPDEIAHLKSSLESGGSVIVIFPATNLTLVEIIMARLDERELALQSVPEPELNLARDQHGVKWGNQWRSKMQIVKPAISDPQFISEKLETHFDSEACRIVLKLPNASPADVVRAKSFLRFRPKDWGTPFFICNYLINPREIDFLEQKISQIKNKWSWVDKAGNKHGIRFISLLSDGAGEKSEEEKRKKANIFIDRMLWEDALIWGVLDMMQVDKKIL